MVKSIDNITSHVTQAIHRLPEKNKDTPGNWDSLIGALVNPAQDLEDIMQSMLDERSITTSEGVNIDRLGEWVGEPRLGRTDSDFLLGIYGKISENNSEGTEKDVMLSVRRFVTADSYVFEDAGEARFKITLTNPTYPTDPRLYASIEATKVAGVGYTEFTTAPINYYGFSNDTGAKGLSTIVNTYYSFYFSNIYPTPSQEIGVYESGGDYTLRMVMENNSDSITFASELTADFVSSTDGHMKFADANGVVWGVESILATTLDDDGTGTGRKLELDLTSSSGTVEHCKIYKFGVEVSMATFLSDFAKVDRYNSPVFDYNWLVRTQDIYDSQAGNYSTLLLKP